MPFFSKLSQRKLALGRVGKASPRKSEGRNKASYTTLEPRHMLAVVINEFLASNSSGLVNDNANRTDWIELHNTGAQTINLAGYSLTDNPSDRSKFVFTNQFLSPGQYLVVFADQDANPTSGNNLYTGFGLSSAGEYVGLFDATGALVSEFASGGSDYPAQFPDVSYGYINDGSYSQPSYFSTPTPGSANSNPVAEVVEQVTASVTPGFYDAAFSVTLSTPTAGAVIFYTTDGSTPSPSNNENDFSQTSSTIAVNVSSTTTLRAVALKSGALSVPDRTWSYLFLDDILDQDGSAPTSDWPSGNVNGQIIDYGIDPDVIAIEGEQAIKDALLAIPTWSITTDVDNLFSSATGIYTNANNDGINWERPASVEQINPDGTEGFQVNAGIRIRGGFSRSDNNPKHALKFFFRSEYGDASLDYDLFKDDPTSTTSFEKIDLRTAQNYSWSFNGDSSNTFITDVLNRENQAALGQPATRSTWVHAYLNGQYWGLYQTQERADANFGASYFGGDADNYDVLKPERGPYQNIATDGNFDAYDELYQQALARAADGVTPAFVDNAAYMRAQGLNPDGTNNPNFKTLLDVENLTAYMLVILHGGNFDAPISNFLGNNRINNYFAVRDRTGDEGFRFFIHDSEHTFRNVNEDRNGPYNHPNFESGVQYFNPQWLHQQLMANEEYRTQFADKVQEAFFDDGAMTVAAQTARLDAHVAALDQAIIAESARWGDSKTSTPLLRSNWVSSVNSLRNFLPNRQNVVLGQFENTVLELKDSPNSTSHNTTVSAPLFSSIEAPDFLINGVSQHGGGVSSGDELGFSGSGGTIYYTTDGTDPRLTGGGLNPNATAFTSTTNVFGFGSNWKFEDSGNDLGTTWQASTFNDAGWSSGVGEFGYGQTTTDTTVSFGDDANNKHTTTYFRKTFNVSPGTYTSVNLSVLRDDGVVIYLNGTEIGRDNITSGAVTYDTFADVFIGGTGETTPINFTIAPALLLAGANTLAVEVHQANLTSSDLTFDAQLSVTSQTPPSGSFVFTTSTNVRARTFGGGAWSALNDVLFVIPAAQSDLRISEIHFNPADPTAAEIAAGFIDNDDFEFIELFNPSTTGTINLSGVQLSDGVTFTFGDTNLLPGQRVVVVEDIDAFMTRYGDSASILGQWSGGLNNGGEDVTLVDSALNEIMSVNYGDNDPWYDLTDGDGFSLVLDDPVGTPTAELGKYYSWRASSEFGGTPGAASTNRSGVVINEILAHTDAPQSDTIELYNPTAQPIDVGYWFLSDSVSSPFKFRIPAGTVIPAGGYLVYDESDFNPTPASPGANDFALSSYGDDVLLTRATVVDGSVLPFVEDAVSFGATFNGDTLGRLPNGTGRLVWLSNSSFGSANSTEVEVGPLVISEVNYHPEDPTAAALAIDPLLTDNDLEYIEIANPSSSTVDLTNWRLRGGSDFNFASGTSLAAGAAIVVVSFDPSLAINAHKLAAFEAHYSIGAGVTIVGGLSASLSNSSGRLSLQQPDAPDSLGVIPHVVVDEVVYDDVSPWPSADGSGQVLERDDLSASGNLSTSWISSTATPGVFEDDFLIADVNLDGVVNFLDIAPFIALLTNNTYQLEADVNQDGVVNFLDISHFIDELTG